MCTHINDDPILEQTMCTHLNDDPILKQTICTHLNDDAILEQTMCTHLNNDAILRRFSQQIWPESNCRVPALKVQKRKLSNYLLIIVALN